MPAVFSPLAKASSTASVKGSCVRCGRASVYANHRPRRHWPDGFVRKGAPDLQPRLAALGGRLSPSSGRGSRVGRSHVYSGYRRTTTLAAREKRLSSSAGFEQLEARETARSLGISRPPLAPAEGRTGLHREAGANGRKPHNRQCNRPSSVLPSRYHHQARPTLQHSDTVIAKPTQAWPSSASRIFQYNRGSGTVARLGYRLPVPDSVFTPSTEPQVRFSDERVTGRLSLVRDSREARLAISGYHGRHLTWTRSHWAGTSPIPLTSLLAATRETPLPLLRDWGKKAAYRKEVVDRRAGYPRP